jgi:protein TonB
LRIHSAKTYPKDAREQHIEGRVKVEFALKQDGNLSSIRVVTPSRHRGLDQAAIEAVKKAAPFPRPPAALFTPPLTLRITILFELV